MSAAAGDRRYAALLRYALLNLAAAALLGAAAIQGWVGEIYESDPSRLTAVIAAVFALGLALCTRLMWRADRALSGYARGAPPAHPLAAAYLDAARTAPAASRAIRAETFRSRLLGEIGLVAHLAGSLVVLGLIGTVIGFIIALSGVDPDIATNPQAVSPMVATLIEGMSVALYTTLVGAVLSVWLGLCHRMLASAVRELAAATVDLGESAAAGGKDSA